MYSLNGVGTNFGEAIEVRRAESEGGVLWEGIASLSPPTRGFAGAL